MKYLMSYVGNGNLDHCIMLDTLNEVPPCNIKPENIQKALDKHGFAVVCLLDEWGRATQGNLWSIKKYNPVVDGIPEWLDAEEITMYTKMIGERTLVYVSDNAMDSVRLLPESASLY